MNQLPLKILVSVLVVIIVFVIYVRLVENASIFYPDRSQRGTPRDIGIRFENVLFKTSDGLTINGWLLPSAGAKSTIIFLHGNAGNNSDRLEKLSYFSDLNVNVFLIDYRGYGQSQGRPNESGVYKDALAAYDYLSKRPDFAGQEIIAYGESLGSAVAVYLATQRKLSAVILESAFTSVPAMARAHMPFIPGFLIKTRMDTLAMIPGILIPKLIIHSVNDEIVPFKMGQKLYASAPVPKTFLELQGDHNSGFFQSKDEYIGGIGDFLRSHRFI